jgi:NAD(P)-dependent dehydrogenase (short-subunit alcohol dehydrogenase family)
VSGIGTAIVTGGASGIGRELARGLAADGWFVVVADLDGEGAEAAAAELPDAEGVRLDVTDADAVRAVVLGVHARRGLHLMINNAGIPPRAPHDTPELDLEDWRRVLDVNLMGVVHGVAAAYPLLVKQGRGAILNTASLAGLTSGPGLGVYGASKHAVVGYSLGLRAEAARYGVRVVVLCPSFVDTPLLDVTTTSTEGETRSIRDSIGPLSTGPLATARQVAAAGLEGVRRNRPVVVVPRRGRALWAMTRWAPGLADRASAAIARRTPGYAPTFLP